MLWEISKQIEGHSICALGDGAAWPVQVGFQLPLVFIMLLEESHGQPWPPLSFFFLTNVAKSKYEGRSKSSRPTIESALVET